MDEIEEIKEEISTQHNLTVIEEEEE